MLTRLLLKIYFYINDMMKKETNFERDLLLSWVTWCLQIQLKIFTFCFSIFFNRISGKLSKLLFVLINSSSNSCKQIIIIQCISILIKHYYYKFDFVTFETLILNWFKLETVKANGLRLWREISQLVFSIITINTKNIWTCYVWMSMSDHTKILVKCVTITFSILYKLSM